MQFEKIKELILKEITDAKIEISGTNGAHAHVHLVVASDQFIGKSLIEQHQRIMDILNELLRNEIHAIKIKTMTIEKYNQL